jgi:hypothetical protein
MHPASRPAGLRDRQRRAVPAATPLRPGQPRRRLWLIIEGAILAIDEVAPRPGEIFALHHDDVDLAAGTIHIHRHLDMATGVIGWPKDDDPRLVVMSPAFARPTEAYAQDR